MEKPVTLTYDEWSFIMCGLRDCADMAEKRANRWWALGVHPEDKEIDREIALENRQLADAIQAQVFNEE